MVLGAFDAPSLILSRCVRCGSADDLRQVRLADGTERRHGIDVRACRVTLCGACESELDRSAPFVRFVAADIEGQGFGAPYARGGHWEVLRRGRWVRV